MLLPFNKRLIAALAISLALHAMLFLLTDDGRHATPAGLRGKLRVTLAAPLHKPQSADFVMPLAYKTAPVVEAASLVPSPPGRSSSDQVSVLPADDHYFLLHEVDKKSGFIDTTPLAKLEKIIAADTEVRLTVKVLINEEGVVDSVTVLEAVPSSIYNEACVSALLQSRFSLAEKGGRKVRSQKILEIKFAAKGVVS